MLQCLMLIVDRNNAVRALIYGSSRIITCAIRLLLIFVAEVLHHMSHCSRAVV